MKKLSFLIILILFSAISIIAQVAVTTDGSSADPSAMLDVKSTEKGFLPPRMTQQEKLDIVNPAIGLVVYDTEVESLFLFNGTDWEPLATGSGSRWDQGIGNDIFRNTGNVGIGTNNPAALLHTEGTGTGEGNVLFTGVLKTTPGSAPASGAGTRMMWYPDKAAFRAGRVAGNEWDVANIGGESFATGLSSKASGRFSTAMGTGTTASGIVSTAMGSGTEASGDGSTAMGVNSIASGNNSTAMGGGTASGDFSRAMGSSSTASGNSSTAMGNSTTASGDFSTAMGFRTTAPSFGETVIGVNSTIYTPASDLFFNSADRLFVIGNGTSNINRSDAMVVMKSGNVGIGTSSPEEILEVENSGNVRIRVTSTNNATAAIDFVRSSTNNTDWRIQNDGNLKLFSSLNIDASVTEEYSFGTGIFRPSVDNSKQLGSSANRWISVFAVNGTIQTSDRRLKKDIETLTYGLEQVNQLQPVTYRWKDGNDETVHVGLIAQEVQQVIPEAVDSSDPDRLGMNYSELVPVLIQAIQELSDQVDVLQEQNTEQAKLIRNLSGTTASLSEK